MPHFQTINNFIITCGSSNTLYNIMSQAKMVHEIFSIKNNLLPNDETIPTK